MKAADILVVDDERDIREMVAGILEDEGYEPRTAASGDEVMDAVAARRPALVVLDIWLQGSRLDGLEILDDLKTRHPELPVVIISGHANIETALTAIRKGAYDFIEKPFTADKLMVTVGRALEASRLRRENADLREKASGLSLLGSSQAMTALRAMVERTASARSRVLIEGPVGAGKEAVARALHDQSPRADHPFVVVSAALIDPARVEEALFGVADTDGRQGSAGLLEKAHNGTLLFDEVGDMPPETQTKILRALIEQRFTRVGGGREVNVDVRILSTTSEDLHEAARQGTFREDLYHRLAVVRLAVPPLTRRREDIELLARHFLDRIADQASLPRRSLGSEALAVLQTYDWPGNVRQLRNALERALILSPRGEGRPISIEDLPEEIMRSGPSLPVGGSLDQIISLPLREAREQFEREYLNAQIARFAGNISRTAAFIGMERSALHRKLKALGLHGGRGGERNPPPPAGVDD